MAGKYKYSGLLGVDTDRLKSGGAAGAASSSGIQTGAAARKAEAAREIAANPTLTMTQQQKSLIQGMVGQHPEIVANAYTVLTDKYTKAFGIMQAGVSNRVQLANAARALDELRGGITTLQSLRTALGLDQSDISEVLKQTLSGYNNMLRDYLDADTRINPIMAPNGGAASTLAQPGKMADGVTTALGADRGIKLDGAQRGTQEIAEWDGREYTADNISDNWGRIMELANAERLTDSQRKEARHIIGAMKKAVKAENTFAKVLSGTNDAQKVRDYQAMIELLEGKTAAGAVGTGFVASFPGAGRLVDNANRELAERGLLSEDVAQAAQRSRTADAQNASRLGYAAGSMAGNLAQLGAASGIVGGATAGLDAAAQAAGKSALAKLGVKALRNAMTFGGVAGLRSIGDQEWKNDAANAALNVAKDTGISAAAGAVGGIAEGLVSTGLARWLSSTGRMTPFWEFIRQTASGTAFAGGMTAAEYTLQEEKPTKEEVATELVTGFLFATLTGALNSVRMTQAGKAYVDGAMQQIERDLNDMETHGGTPEEIQSAADNILNYTQDLRTTISQNYYPGQQEYIDRILGTLDGLDQVVRARAATTPDMAGNLLSGSAAEGGAMTAAGMANTPNNALAAVANAPTAPKPVSTGTAAGAAAQAGRKAGALQELRQARSGNVTDNNFWAYDAMLQPGDIASERNTAAQDVTVDTQEAEVSANENGPTVTEGPETNNETIGGMNDGEGNGLSDGEGRRSDREGAGVEAGAVRPVGYGDNGKAPQTRRGNGAPFAVEVFRSPAELNIPRGGSVANNGVIRADTWTDDMRSAADMLRNQGYETTYVTGPIEVWGKDGRIRRVAGVIHGNSVVAQADGRMIRGEQNALHEYFHSRVADDPALMADLKERFVAEHTDEQLMDIALRYAQIYDFAYHPEQTEEGVDPLESMTDDELDALMDMYLEEYFADAAGNINRVKMDSRGAGRDAAMVWNILSEREGMGSGAGGMPGVKYALDEYSEHQIENWKSSKKIIIYQNDAQLRDFVHKASTEGDFVGKMYFGTVSQDLAERIETATGFDFLGRNVTLRAGNVRKILNRHGNDITERKWNQRAITIDDFVLVPHIISDPDSISPTNYEGRNAVVFEKDYSDISRKVIAVDSGGSLELFVQTMYTGKEKGSIASMVDANSPTLTPETTAGTAPNDSISDSTKNSNTENEGLRSRIPGLTRWDREAEAREAARKAQSERAPDLLNTEENVNRPRFSAAEDAGEIGEAAYEEQQRARLQANVEAMTPTELRRAVTKDRAELETLRKWAGSGLTAEQRRGMAELQERLKAEEARKAEVDKKLRTEKKAAQERAVQRQAPKRAREDLIKDTLDHFGITEGRNEIGGMIGRYFDDARSRGREREQDRTALFLKLLDAGMFRIEADETMSRIRGDLSHVRIYVPERVRSDFGDDYSALCRRAFANGIILTGDVNDSQIDVLNDELAERYPGSFRAGETDSASMLEGIIEAAEQGRSENVNLWEMMQRNQNNEGWSVDDQIDRHIDWLDNRIDKALYAAEIEVEQKARGAMQLARERAERREALERQAQRKQLTELRNKDLRLLQWMNRNKHRATTDEMREQIDELLATINYITINMADEAQYLDKYNATVGDLVKIYEAAKKSNPNWLPSREMENLVHRTHSLALGDMDVDTLDQLYHNMLEIQTEIFNSKHMIDDDQHRLVQEVYDQSVEEIENSRGKGKTSVLDLLFTPINFIEKLGGWNAEGATHSMGRQLQAGERTAKAYVVGAQDILRPFTLKYAKWLRTADGQGRNGQWIKYEIPEYEYNDYAAGTTIYGETKTVWITPLQRVHLYLEIKNDQNMNHMQEGGRIFADKDLYSKGKRSEAFGAGTRVKLSREWANTICADMTAEEIELADLLESYYNNYAPEWINPVSQKMVGYDKAVIENYTPIQTSDNYNNKQPGLYDLTAAGVGVMKDRQYVANNPSLNVGAIDAFERHVNQTSKYVGLAIPVSNFTRLMNWQNKDAGTSYRDIIAHKWGQRAVTRLDNFLTEIQNPNRGPDSEIGRWFDKHVVSNYVGATFASNIGIAMQQFASFPAAAAVLDGKVASLQQIANVDEDLIQKYTPELAYRKMGYATPEIAEMRNNPNWLDRHKATRFWLRGGMIQAVDVFTVRTLWPWAENTVKKNNPELQVGTDEYYREVANTFNEAVNVTQPMYDYMNRASIMGDRHVLTRTVTMFKTVPMQVLNTLAKYINEARGGDGKSKRRAAMAVASTIGSMLMLSVFRMLAAGLKNGLKYYRDDDGDLTAESVAKGFGFDFLGNLIGNIPGASWLYEAALKQAGLSGYSNDFKFVGMEQIQEITKELSDAGKLLYNTAMGAWDVQEKGGDVEEYFRRNAGDIRGGIKDLATVAAKYMGGLPLENIEKYFGGFVARAAGRTLAKAMGLKDPGATYDSFFDTTTKNDLSYIDTAELPARLDSLLAIRDIDADEATSAELARLYNAGYAGAVPSDTPSSIDGRDLSAYEMQVYDSAYSAAIGESLDALVESDGYIEADDAGRAAMLESLYTYANQTARREIEPDYEGDSWTRKAAEATESGIDPATYIEARQAMKAADAENDGNNSITQAEAETALRGMDLTNVQRAVLWRMTNSGWSAEKNPFTAGYEEPVNTMEPIEIPEQETTPEPRQDPTDREYLNSLYADLKPPAGMDAVTKTQKYRAIVDAFESVEDQVAALETIMSDSELLKIRIGRSRNVTPALYVASKEAMYAGDTDGRTDQMEAKYALDDMDLTNEQRAVLWQVTNTSWKPQRNPYNTNIGEAVYDELHGGELQEIPQESRTASGPTYRVPAVSLPGYG